MRIMPKRISNLLILSITLLQRMLQRRLSPQT
jgi:hypothetical protein